MDYKSIRYSQPNLEISSKKVLEAVSKPHLRPNGRVVPRIKMLTYSRVRSAFEPIHALPSGMI